MRAGDVVNFHQARELHGHAVRPAQPVQPRTSMMSASRSSSSFRRRRLLGRRIFALGGQRLGAYLPAVVGDVPPFLGRPCGACTAIASR